MDIKIIIPGYNRVIRDRLECNGSALKLTLQYQNFYEKHLDDTAIDVFSRIGYQHKKALEAWTSNPDNLLEYLDQMRVLEYILINKPIRDLETLSKYLVHELRTYEKYKDTKRKILGDINTLNKYIKRAKEIQRKK